MWQLCLLNLRNSAFLRLILILSDRLRPMQAYAQGKSEQVMGEAIQLGIKEGVWERCDLVCINQSVYH